MAIRKKLIVDPISGIVKGYRDIGRDCVDESKQATEALVFRLVPLASRTPYPVGFFFVDKIDANLQSVLISQCLQISAESSIDIVNITCDGCSSNVLTLQKLGATLPDAPWFNHPCNEQIVSIFPESLAAHQVKACKCILLYIAILKVHATLDPVHMLKLCRNAFSILWVFHSESGAIEYRYIEELFHL